MPVFVTPIQDLEAEHLPYHARDLVAAQKLTGWVPVRQRVDDTCRVAEKPEFLLAEDFSLDDALHSVVLPSAGCAGPWRPRRAS